MSADTEIANLLNTAVTNANFLTGAAQQQVNTAIATLAQEITYPLPPASPDEAGFSEGSTSGSASGSAPPTFPSLPNQDLGSPPPLQVIDSIYDTVSDTEFPSLTLPSFTYPELSDFPVFSVPEPDVDTTFVMPDPPDTGLVSPTWNDYETLSVPAITTVTDEFAPIDVSLQFDPYLFENSLARFRSDITPGIDTLLNQMKTWCDTTLSTISPTVIQALQEGLSGIYSPVIALQSSIRERLTDRLSNETARASAALVDNSGWDIPFPIQTAINRAIENVSYSFSENAKSDFDAKTEELTLAFSEFCGSLLDGLSEGIQSLRIREIEQLLYSHQTAITYAKEITNALLSVFETNQFTIQEAYTEIAEAELGVFESSLKTAMIRFEIANIFLELESMQQDQDALRINQYKIDSDQAALDVKLYASQVTAARNELELKSLPTDVFILQVKSFASKVDAADAKVNAQIAELSGDKGRIAGELSKVKVYSEKAKAFDEKISAKSIIASAQADRNEAVIAEYEKLVKSELEGLKKSIIENQYALSKYEVISEDAIADAKIAIKVKEADLSFAIQKQQGILDAYRLTQERMLDIVESELGKLKSIAIINSNGADILAGMAEGAMSAANGIASVVFKETEL